MRPKPGDLRRKSPSSLASGTIQKREGPGKGPFFLPTPNSRERAERGEIAPVAVRVLPMERGGPW